MHTFRGWGNERAWVKSMKKTCRVGATGDVSGQPFSEAGVLGETMWAWVPGSASDLNRHVHGLGPLQVPVQYVHFEKLPQEDDKDSDVQDGLERGIAQLAKGHASTRLEPHPQHPREEAHL